MFFVVVVIVTADNLRVIAKCLDSHPMCQHGPTLLFERKSEQKTQQFYACSAYRDQSECSIHIAVDQYIEPNKVDHSQIKIERSLKRATEQSALLKRVKCETEGKTSVDEPKLTQLSFSDPKTRIYRTQLLPHMQRIHFEPFATQ